MVLASEFLPRHQARLLAGENLLVKCAIKD